MINVFPAADLNLDSFADQLSEFSLWWEDLIEAGIEELYFAFNGDNNEIIGFQSVNGDGRTIAIETKDDFLGTGVASKLIEVSGSWKPERNECPEFWEKMESLYA